MKLTRDQRARLGHLRRRAVERLGSLRYSHVGDPVVERRLAELLPERGYFVEAGANDGIWHSNTYILEKRGWDGLLIEPIPELAERCASNRRVPVQASALVSPDYAEDSVPMVFAGLVSQVRGGDEEADWLFHAKRVEEVKPYPVDATPATLTEALEDAGTDEVDFLSLDVEGYAVQALRGLDITRFCPTVILVEVSAEDLPLIESYLSDTHNFVEWVTERDGLFLASDP